MSWSTFIVPSGLVAVIGIPIGIGAGVYLEEYSPPGRVRRIVQTNIANLAGVPSIVYGILGLALFVRAFGIKALALGPALLAGVLTLSLLILPIIVITTQEALRAVPQSLRQAALALGATRWQMVRDHVLPSAMPGILTGIMLAVARGAGETAPLLFTALFCDYWLSGKLFEPTASLAVLIYDFSSSPFPNQIEIAWAASLVLVLIVLGLNLGTQAIYRRAIK